jgi:Flp pilus assembly protein TadB
MIKLPSIFTRIPNHKRFNYTPRHYDPQEEERREREDRIQRELSAKDEQEQMDSGYRARITGSFRTAKKLQAPDKPFDPSANMIRLIILTFLVVWIIAYLHYGSAALYALVLFIPFYLWLKFVRK